MLPGARPGARRVKAEALDNYLADNCNAWLLQPDGGYQRVSPGHGDTPHSAQATLLDAICG